MSVFIRGMNGLLRWLFRAVCRIDHEELKKIPRSGPLILVGNHINFLEVPILAPHLDNPALTGLAKRETWKNPLFNLLFNLWGIIPIDRNMVDREAFNLAAAALNQGKILAISPEGTRSKNGRLLPGKPGVVALAIRTQAPLLAAGFYGYENFWSNLKSLRRTDFHIRVGRPFRINMAGQLLSRDVRQAVTDEIMYKIAELLPERYRGHYQFDHPPVFQYLVDLPSGQ